MTSIDRHLWTIGGIMDDLDEIGKQLEKRISEAEEDTDEYDDLFDAKIRIDDAWKTLSKWREFK